MITREDILFLTKETKKLQNFFEKGDFEKVIKNSLGYLKQLQKKYPELKIPIDDGLKLL